MSSMMFPLNEGMYIRPRKLPLSAWTGHIPFGSWLIHAMRPGVLVELGTHRGASFLSFCQAIEEASVSARCYAVDTWCGDEHAGVYKDSVFSELNAYHQPLYGGFSQLMRMTFDEGNRYFLDGEVDLLHIDGLHTYEAVRHDFDSWKTKLSSRAVVLFHDIHVKERNFGVWKLWRELCEEYASFEFTHSHGLGVLLLGPDISSSLDCLKVEKGSSEERGVGRLFESLGERLKSDSQVDGLVKEIEKLGGDIHELHSIIKRLNAEATQRIDELHTRDRALNVFGTSLNEISRQTDGLRELLDTRINDFVEVVQSRQRESDTGRDTALNGGTATSFRSCVSDLLSSVEAERGRSSQLIVELSSKLGAEFQSAGDLYARRVSDLESAIFDKDSIIVLLSVEAKKAADDLKTAIDQLSATISRMEGLEFELEECKSNAAVLHASSSRNLDQCLLLAAELEHAKRPWFRKLGTALKGKSTDAR